MSLRRTVLAAVAAAVIVPFPARAYPIDCAILLCLAGGWPPAAECVAAKTEVIRRITPWPIEPPLQLWRCPMGAADQGTVRPREQLYRIASSGPSPASTAVLDDPSFDFVRALRVYHIRFTERWSDTSGSCSTTDATRVGLYDNRGAYHWRSFAAGGLPHWAPRPDGCASRRGWRAVRAVGVSWRTFDGTTGHELIHY